MMTETGRVVAIESDCLWVETIRQSTCNSCSVQKGCGHSLLNKAHSGKAHHLRVLLDGIPATRFDIDDEVQINVPERVLVLGALIVYLLPLGMLLLGALVSAQFFTQDFLVFLGAVMGFGAGVGLVRLHAINTKNDVSLQPIVVKENAGRDTAILSHPLS